MTNHQEVKVHRGPIAVQKRMWVILKLLILIIHSGEISPEYYMTPKWSVFYWPNKDFHFDKHPCTGVDVLSTMTFYVKPIRHHILEALRHFLSDQKLSWDFSWHFSWDFSWGMWGCSMCGWGTVQQHNTGSALQQHTTGSHPESFVIRITRYIFIYWYSLR